MGGLGNQLFIMAAAYGYAKKHGRECVIHLPSVNRRTINTTPYESTVFKSFRKVDSQYDCVYKEPDDMALSFVNIGETQNKFLLLWGYFQNEKYFDFCKKEFLSKLSLHVVDTIKNTCFIHIRRGDYLNISFHNIPLLNYYENAIRYMLTCNDKTNFLVFSDDIGWCKEQALFKRPNMSFCEEEDEVKAMMMMAACENGGICANSSFSWWGSYLNPNPNKIVTFPDKWFNDPRIPINIYFQGSKVIRTDEMIQPLRVRVFSSFCSSEQATNNYINVCDTKDNIGSLVHFVTDDSYTHAILINDAMPALTVPKRNVIGMSCEPYAINGALYSRPDFVAYLRKHARQYFVGKLGGLPSDVFVPHYSFMWHKWQRPNEGQTYDKKYNMSIVLSKKAFLPGHKYRHTLVESILKTDMDIHVWGRGSAQYGTDSRLKGEFNDAEPYEQYKFTIVIENSCEDGYVSEKYTDAIGYNCVCLYLGCPNIKNIFGNKCCIPLTGNITLDMEIIRRVYTDPDKYTLDMKTAKHELYHGRAYLPAFLVEYFALQMRK